MALCVLFALFTSVLKAQDAVKISIKATVNGSDGRPLKGATINNEANKISVVTDEKGRFSVEVPADAILTVTAPGHKPSLILATSDLNQISLTKDVRMVQVAFNKVDEAELPTGVSNVDVATLLEKSYFTYSLDGMEALASGFNMNGIWGMTDVMILVDGVPRDAGSVTPNEIDQVTFLKSAPAVALYGSRGARGVILITTKRGVETAQKITVRTNAGVNVPKRFPSYLGSSEYMTLYNEALTNDAAGGAVSGLYTQSDIFNHSGVNPYRYPDVDFYSSDYLKNSFGRYDAVTEIYGGNERARYYTNLGFNRSGSLLDFGEAKKNNTSDRFNIRGNVDMQLTRALKARVDATAAFSTGRGINADYWGGAATIRPNRFVPLIPLSFIEDSDSPSWAAVSSASVIDGKYLLGGTSFDQTNPIAAGYLGGKNGYVQREFQFTTGIDADLKGILEGLTFNATLGQDYYNRYNQGYRNGYATYQANWSTYSGRDLITSLSAPFGQDTRNGQQVIADSWYRQTTSLSSQFNYNTAIDNKHNISAVLMGAAYRRTLSENYQPETNSNLGLQMAYNLSRKYYADFTAAVVHSAKFAPGKRTAFSPAVSIGWRISEESFLKGSSIFDNLMLTASAGILHTDLDLSDYFFYEGIFVQPDQGGNWHGWNDGSGYMSTEYRRGDNPELTFAKRKEVSFGLQASMFKKQLDFGLNVFRIESTDIPIQNNALFPNYFAQFFPVSSLVPYVNYNADLRSGIDFQLNLKKRLGAVDLGVGTSATYVTTEATKRADMVVYNDVYQYRQGKPLDALWGLENDGFYMDAGEAAAASSREANGAVKPAFGEVRAGDIKYKDQNNDGIINEQDEVYLGRAGWFGSPLTLGLNFTAKWKNFSLFALGTGRFGGTGMKNNNYFWVNGADKYSVVVRDRWTEETKNTATFPRLTTQAGNNNFRNSDFWTYSTDRFDLSRVQLSYNFSQKLIKGKFVKDLGVYVTGFNLLTVAKEKELMEMNIGGSPQTRLYNLGVKALF